MRRIHIYIFCACLCVRGRDAPLIYEPEKPSAPRRLSPPPCLVFSEKVTGENLEHLSMNNNARACACVCVYISVEESRFQSSLSAFEHTYTNNRALLALCALSLPVYKSEEFRARSSRDNCLSARAPRASHQASSGRLAAAARPALD